MRYSRDEIEKNLNSIDRQLLLMIYDEMKEMNHLLRQLTNENKQVDPEPEPINLDELKRPELMKRMARLQNKPQGWNKWETEDIRKHLKGVS